MNTRLQRLLVLSAVCLFAASHAEAAQLTENFVVTVTVNASCSLTAGDIGFGNWDPLSGDASSTGTVSVTCSTGLPYAVSIDPGSHYSVYDCVSPQRRMASNGNYLAYGLYQDAGQSVDWGCDASSDLDGVGSGTPMSHTVHARIPAAQSVIAGAYQDDLVATITF